jgi:hypothetical protein
VPRRTESAKSKPTVFVLRATLHCVAAHVIPSLTLRVHTFSCCLHAQVKHPLFAGSFCTRRPTSFHSDLYAQMTHTLRRRVVISMLLSSHYGICPMDFRVHHRKHQTCGTRRSYPCRHRRTSPDFGCRVTSDPPCRDEWHLPWTRRAGLGIDRPSVLDPCAWSATLREDIFPGHPQYFAVRRTRSLDLDQARCDAGHRAVALRRGMVVPLRPERRSRMSAGRRTRRLVTDHERIRLGCRGGDCGCNGQRQPVERSARRRASLDRACRCAALHAAPCSRHGTTFDARRPEVD